jgi:GntR family transcriptional regulator
VAELRCPEPGANGPGGAQAAAEAGRTTAPHCAGHVSGASITADGGRHGRLRRHQEPVPLYLQIVCEVSAAIEDGRYPVGARLPSAETLARQHGVSRQTARRVLAVLRQEGLAVSIKRLGLFTARRDAAATAEQLVERQRILDELGEVWRRVRSLEAASRQPPGLPRWDPGRLPAGNLPGRASRLWVGVLGPVEVAGPSGPLTGPRADLVVALAVHGAAGLSMQALRKLLGNADGALKSHDTVRQLIVRTRRQLGPVPGGGEWIETDRGPQGRYWLHEATVVDWAWFRSLSTRGGRAGSWDDLASALALVRGAPFTGFSRWWLDPSLAERIRAEIVAAAETLSALHLAAGNPGAAALAIRTGLVADPGNTHLEQALSPAPQPTGRNHPEQDPVSVPAPRR